MARLSTLLAMPHAFHYPTKLDFFETADWFRCLADAVFGDDRAAIYISNHSALVLRPTVMGVRSYTNFYSLSFRIGPEADEVIRMLAQDAPSMVDLRLVPEGDAIAVAKSLERCGFKAYQYFMYDNWIATLNGDSFDTFFSSRPSQLRNTIKRRKKKLGSEHRFQVRLDRHGSLLKDFLAVYERSWKRPERYPNFIPTLASTCAKLGILRLGVLYVDDKPAAAQLWITTPAKAVIYKLAYDEDYKTYSVGSILSEEMFREAIDIDKVSEIDYGVGSEAYKRDWMDQSRRLVGVRAYNTRSVLGASFWCSEQIKTWIKQRVRTAAARRAPT